MIWSKSMQCTCEQQQQLQHHLDFKSNTIVFCKQKISYKKKRNETHTHCLISFFLFLFLSLFLLTSSISPSLPLSLLLLLLLFSFCSLVVFIIVVGSSIHIILVSSFICCSMAFYVVVFVCVWVSVIFSLTNPTQLYHFLQKRLRKG